MTIARDSTPEVFWKAFEAALEMCEPDEVVL
jgi:hypothetical protein